MDSSDLQLVFVVESLLEFIVNGNLLVLGTNSDGVNALALTVKPFVLN